MEPTPSNPRRYYQLPEAGRALIYEKYGREFILVEWTAPCSGCVDDREGHAPQRGAGCPECGYHGVRRRREFADINPQQPDKPGRDPREENPRKDQ